MKIICCLRDTVLGKNSMLSFKEGIGMGFMVWLLVSLLESVVLNGVIIFLILLISYCLIRSWSARLLSASLFLLGRSVVTYWTFGCSTRAVFLALIAFLIFGIFLGLIFSNKDTYEDLLAI